MAVLAPGRMGGARARLPQQVALDGLAIEGTLERLTGEGSARASACSRAVRAAYFSPRWTSASCWRSGHRDQPPRATCPRLALGGAIGRDGLGVDYKNLQRQLRKESTRAWPEERADGSRPVVVRKGARTISACSIWRMRCRAAAGRPAVRNWWRAGPPIRRWRHDWRRPARQLGTLFRKRGIAALTDQHGECVMPGVHVTGNASRRARASAQADLVIANRALVMVNAARGRGHAQHPTRIVFDEGHHVFDAADRPSPPR